MKFSGIFGLCVVIFGMSQCKGFHSTSASLNALFTSTPAVNFVDNDNIDAGQKTSNVSSEETIKKKPYINFRFMESFYVKTLSIFLKDPDTLRMVAKFFSWITWAYIILSAFGTMGYDTKPLLSLLSVSGLTIGFAAKDILTNTFKGLFILLTKPFHRNWTISVNGFRGKVISIDSRFVKLQSLQSPFSEILIPLSMIYDTAIIIEKKEEF